jgi:AAA domain, putative AbiEii toxin, Type IV TA system
VKIIEMSEFKKHPIQVLDCLNELNNHFNENMNSGLALKVNPIGGLFSVEDTKDDFYFKIINYEIFNNQLLIYVKMRPNSYIDSSESNEYIDPDYVLTTFMSWLDLVSEYERFEEFGAFFEKEMVLNETTRLPSGTSGKLPTCLKQIVVRNYKSIKETEINDIPENAQWIFLIGENGFGKTLILQSIFMGLYGIVDNNTILANSKDIKIGIEFIKNNNTFFAQTFDYGLDTHRLANYLVAIGASRLNLANESATEVTTKSSISYSLFNTDGLLLNIDFTLKELAIKGEKKFDKFIRCFLQLLNPYLSEISYDKANDCIFYYEKDEENEQYKPVKYDSLASGFKSIIGMAGDIIIRLSKHQEINELTDLEGIVLIDEFDLHLHPKFQIEAVKAFTKVFPKIQFIVSTHSPMPLLGAPLTSQVYKVNRTKEKGVFVEKMDVNLKVLTPNLILTSPIFDLDNIANIHADIDEVEVEDDYEELEKNKKIDELLSNTDALKKKYPDSIFQ